MLTNKPVNYNNLRVDAMIYPKELNFSVDIDAPKIYINKKASKESIIETAKYIVRSLHIRIDDQKLCDKYLAIYRKFEELIAIRRKQTNMEVFINECFIIQKICDLEGINIKLPKIDNLKTLMIHNGIWDKIEEDIG